MLYEVITTGTNETCLLGNSRFGGLWHAQIDCAPGQPSVPIFAGILYGRLHGKCHHRPGAAP